MMRDFWESFTWAMNTATIWVRDFLTDWWESSPLSLLGVVITIAFAFVVTFRRAS